MLYPQNGDRIVAIDYVTSFHPVYTHVHTESLPIRFRPLKNAVTESSLPARRYASAGTSYCPVSDCIRLLQAGVLKTVERIGLVLAWKLFRPILHCFIRKFWYVQK